MEEIALLTAQYGLAEKIIGLIIAVAGLVFIFKKPKSTESTSNNSSAVSTEGQTGSNLVQQQKGGEGNQIIQNQTNNYTPPANLPSNDPLLNEVVAQVLNKVTKIEERPEVENLSAEAVGEVVREQLKALIPALQEEAATDPRGRMALEALEKGNAGLAQELFKELRKEEKVDEAKRDEEHAQTALNLGRSFLVELKFHDAQEAFEDAHRLNPSEWIIVNELEQIYHTLGQYSKTQKLLEDFLPQLIEQKGGESTEVATAYNNLGEAWREKGEYDKAITYYEKALAIDLKNFGEDHPDTAIDYNNLGAAWWKKGDQDEAISYYEKALAIDLKIFGESHPQIAFYYNNLGTAWRAKGEYDKAIEYHNKALVIRLDKLGEQHPLTAASYNNLGFAWESKGNFGEAISYYEKSLEILQKMLGLKMSKTTLLSPKRRREISSSLLLRQRVWI